MNITYVKRDINGEIEAWSNEPFEGSIAENVEISSVNGRPYIFGLDAEEDKRVKNTLYNNKVLSIIAELESQQTRRRLREAALSEAGKSWLQNLEDSIEEERKKLIKI